MQPYILLVCHIGSVPLENADTVARLHIGSGTPVR